MRDFNPAQPLIFIHIPKTAGTAVRAIVDRWFPDRVHSHYFNAATQALPERLDLDLPAYRHTPPVIYGHFNKLRGFGIEDYYPKVSQFVTILRDPFEAAASAYFYLRRVQSPRAPNVPVDLYLQHADSHILNHFPRQMTLANYTDIIEQMFVAIGISEALPDSLDLIAARLGHSFDPADLKVVNTTARDQQIAEGLREAFVARHPLEYAVYDFARAKLRLGRAADPT